jgi:hypothetical protein
VILNSFSIDGILRRLSAISRRKTVWVMIHEQYFYEDYAAYQPNFEEKLERTFAFLREQGYESAFFEEISAI